MALTAKRILFAHLKIFKVLGFCSVSESDNLLHQLITERCLLLWSWFLLIGFNVITFVVLLSKDEFLYKGDNFGCFNDVIKIVFANLAVNCAYLESIFKRCSIRKFWQIYNCLQKHPDEGIKCFNSTVIWRNFRYLLIFYTTIAVEFIGLLVFLIFQSKNRHLILFWSAYLPFSYVVHMRNMQFIFFIEILRLELIKLQQDLQLIVDYSRFVAYGCGFKGIENFLRREMQSKQKHYELIHEMFEHFQNAFGLSIVAVLLKIYIQVLADSYFAYYALYMNRNKYGKYAFIF